MYDPVRFGEEIQELRKDMGLRQAELARKLHIGETTLCRIENGSDTTLQIADKLLSELGGTLKLGGGGRIERTKSYRNLHRQPGSGES